MKFHIYKDKRGEWRWRLVARNGRIVADSGESYKRLSAIKKSIGSIRKASLAIVED